jgi:cell division protein FtsB
MVSAEPTSRIPRDPPQERPRVLRRQQRSFWPHAMLFTACVLLANGLFGDHGLTETFRARRAQAKALRELNQLKQENAGLRDMARRLLNDPATIEAVARGQLGLVREGEILVTIRDTK